jgi:hypothetical protein
MKPSHPPKSDTPGRTSGRCPSPCVPVGSGRCGTPLRRSSSPRSSVLLRTSPAPTFSFPSPLPKPHRLRSSPLSPPHVVNRQFSKPSSHFSLLHHHTLIFDQTATSDAVTPSGSISFLRLQHHFPTGDHALPSSPIHLFFGPGTTLLKHDLYNIAFDTRFGVPAHCQFYGTHLAY